MSNCMNRGGMVNKMAYGGKVKKMAAGGMTGKRMKKADGCISKGGTKCKMR